MLHSEALHGHRREPLLETHSQFDECGNVFGNRRQKQEDNSGNPFPQTWTEVSDIDPATNRLAASTGVSYDDSGNVEIDPKYRHLKFEYDANNRQKQSSNLDGTDVVKSVYDATGQRVATQVAGALTNVLVYDAMGKLVAEYGNSSGANGTQYVMADHQGSTRAVLNNAGTVVSRHDYLPFGEEMYAGVGMRSTGQRYNAADNVRQKYAGMETDDVTGMAHTLWRQYDSLSGRWTAPDPYGGSMTVADPQSFNRYIYVNNDPINQIDPSGLMGTLPDASTSWSEVSDGFWGKSFDFSTPPRGPSTGEQAANQIEEEEGRVEYCEYCPDDDDPAQDPQNTEQQGPEPSTVDVVYQPGTLAQLPRSGPGYYSSGRRWVEFGDLRVVSELIEFAAQWNKKHPGFDIGIGEMSDINGRSPKPHRSHKQGLRVDIRPMRTDGKHEGTDWRPEKHRAYNQALTIELIRGLRSLPGVKNILFNDPVTRAAGLTLYYKYHDNHLHVNFTRFR